MGGGKAGALPETSPSSHVLGEKIQDVDAEVGKSAEKEPTKENGRASPRESGNNGGLDLDIGAGVKGTAITLHGAQHDQACEGRKQKVKTGKKN